MANKRMGKLVVIGALLVAGLLFTQFTGVAPAARVTDNDQFAQKINLVLRRTAHHLLAEAGDSATRIPPVRQVNATTFVIRLERPFDYGRLPALLKQSFDIHGINGNYDVALLDCTKGELQLGYNVRDVTGQQAVPCEGRNQQPGCYTLQLSFAVPEAAGPPTPLWWPWAVGLLLLGGAYVVWQQAGTTAKGLLPSDPVTNETDPLIRVGNLSFNPANQSVGIAGITHSLTYREAKLLTLFLRHPNHVLGRDFILKSVWEDEGIIVGRSVDVFVSRLRKLIQADPTVRIVAVHGVGYRLEVG